MQDRIDPIGDSGSGPAEREADYSWLQASGAETPVPILFTTTVRVGVDPWHDELLRSELDAFAQDQAKTILQRGDGEPGRILMVTDLVEEPDSRVRVAASLAADFARAGLRTVLVDADLRFVGLARHLDDSIGDAEGFVDAIEYGASGSALLRPTPLEGVRVLPAGSYRPDRAQASDDEALRRLARQLREIADVVLVLAPAFTSEGRFHGWFVHSDGVVLGLALDRSLAGALDELRHYLDGLGIELAALVARGSRDPAEVAVDVALDDAEKSPARGASPYSMDPRSGSEAGSSAGVRRLATVLLVVLVAFVAWWGWTEWNGRDSDQSPMEVTQEVTRQETPAHASDDGPQDGTQVGTHDGPHEGLPVVAVGDAAVTEVDGSGLLPPEAASQGASVPGDSVRAVTTSGAEELAGPGTEEGTAEAEAEASADAPPAPSAGEMPLPAALTSPVGGGWSLHPWSFADSTDADRALETLVRLGMQPEVRSASIDGRTWYRVLVGSFPSRAEAWQQRERLASMVETDWVGVVRVTP